MLCLYENVITLNNFLVLIGKTCSSPPPRAQKENTCWSLSKILLYDRFFGGGGGFWPQSLLAAENINRFRDEQPMISPYSINKLITWWKERSHHKPHGNQLGQKLVKLQSWFHFKSIPEASFRISLYYLVKIITGTYIRPHFAPVNVSLCYSYKTSTWHGSLDALFVKVFANSIHIWQSF